MTRVPRLNTFLAAIRRSGLLERDIDYHLLRISMLVIFAFFSYQKWFEYEAERLVPFISHGPLIWWLYPLFGVRGPRASHRRPWVLMKTARVRSGALHPHPSRLCGSGLRVAIA